MATWAGQPHMPTTAAEAEMFPLIPLTTTSYTTAVKQTESMVPTVAPGALAATAPEGLLETAILVPCTQHSFDGHGGGASSVGFDDSSKGF